MNDAGINCDCGGANGCAAPSSKPYQEESEPKLIPFPQGRQAMHMDSNRAEPLDAEALRAKWAYLCGSIGSHESNERKAG